MPVIDSVGRKIELGPSGHSKFICNIVQQFDAHFFHGARLVYASDDSGNPFFDKPFLASLGIKTHNQRKLPDAVIYYPEKNWLILVEAVSSHGPIDTKRHKELKKRFKGSQAGLIFITAFPDRRVFGKLPDVISWETEVWIADSPSHMIHYNGSRLLGPAQQKRLAVC